MKIVPYVGQAAIQFISDLEHRFQVLQSDARVMFISIAGVPAENGNTREFKVFAGVSKDLTVQAGEAIVLNVLDPEIKAGIKFDVSVRRGVSCLGKPLAGSIRSKLATVAVRRR